jgi:hypothetical protein
VRLEGLGKSKKIHLIGTRTRNLPACNIVPQPTTLPRAPIFFVIEENCKVSVLDTETCLYFIERHFELNVVMQVFYIVSVSKCKPVISQEDRRKLTSIIPPLCTTHRPDMQSPVYSILQCETISDKSRNRLLPPSPQHQN